MDVEIPGLLVFRHVAETGSFTETARFWRISQPAASTLISRLESSVGLILLERSSTGATLTPAGIEFLKWAAEVCDAYLAFITGVRTMGRRTRRQVLLGLDQSSFGERLRTMLGESRGAGGVDVSVCETGIQWWRDLESSKYDLVVAGRFLQGGLAVGIQEGVVARERGITVAWNPDYYAFDPAEFNFPEAMRTSVLMPDEKVVTGFASFLLLWCDVAYGVRPANVVTFPSEREAAVAASAGLGVFLGPGNAMRRVGALSAKLSHVRTFEFLLPEAFTLGVYCRAGEDSKEVLSAAVAIGRMAAGIAKE